MVNRKRPNDQQPGGSGASGSIQNMLQPKILTDREFNEVSDKIYQLCRINLHDGKKELVQARLNKRLRVLGIDTYAAYRKYVENDQTGREIIEMIDVLTTNLTFFFREPDHFDFLKTEVLDKLTHSSKLRIWSAGCSTGEEPYTLAIMLREHIPHVELMDALILATDISTKVLAKAKAGKYEGTTFRNTSKTIIQKYFHPLPDKAGLYQVGPELSRLIRFRHLNLMGPWPFTGKFDVIFCRNVMIYFDKPTQQELVARYYESLRPGGYFMVGHSESLSGIKHSFKYVKPSIYIK